MSEVITTEKELNAKVVEKSLFDGIYENASSISKDKFTSEAHFKTRVTSFEDCITLNDALTSCPRLSQAKTTYDLFEKYPDIFKIMNQAEEKATNFDSKGAFKNLDNIKNYECRILQHFIKMPNMDGEQYAKILKGAHTLIHDGGAFYKEIKKMKKSRQHSSSHHSIKKQYHLNGPFLKELIVGTKKVNAKVVTWFQLERNTAQNFWNTIFHLKDWIKYKFLGRNIGPYGDSRFTEKKDALELFPPKKSKK